MDVATFGLKNAVKVNGQQVGQLKVFSERKSEGGRQASVHLFVTDPRDGEQKRVDTHQSYMADAKKWAKDMIDYYGLAFVIDYHGLKLREGMPVMPGVATRKGALKVCDLPRSAQPEYRASYVGVSALTNTELVQVIAKFADVESAMLLVAKAGTLRGLAAMTVEEMETVDGVSGEAALAIKAALELGRRMDAEDQVDRSSVSNPRDFYNLLSYMQFLPQEHIVVVMCDTKMKVLGTETVAIGTVSECQFRLADIYRMAVRRNATCIAVAHNHPSGDTTPSPQDVVMTKMLVEAGQLMGIEVLDHLIIGHGKYLSMKERKLGFS